MYSLQRNPLTATWLYADQRRCPLHITYLVRETRHKARPALGQGGRHQRATTPSALR